MIGGTYTLADLTAATGAKRRSVQLWAEAGVLVADNATERAGSGTHRTFDANEVVVACLIHAVAQRGVSIGKLLVISNIIRKLVFSSEPHVQTIKAAIENTLKVYVIVDSEGMIFCPGTQELQNSIPFVMDKRTEIDMTAIVINLNICLSRARRYIDG